MARAEPVPGTSKEAGCALCGSSWGNYWQVVEGTNLFFCCSICGAAYANAVDAVKGKTGWPRVDRLFIEDVRGNEGDGWATHGNERVEFTLAGTDEGEITRLDLH
ncbi:MAG: TA0938 family protein [Thermoplasmatota archaeon]